MQVNPKRIPRAVGSVVWCSLASSILVSAAPPPPPFTAVQVTAERFECLGRASNLGEFLLPTQVIAASQPVLASPVRLVAEPNFLEGLHGRATVQSNHGDSATLDWSAESPDLRASSKLTADC